MKSVLVTGTTFPSLPHWLPIYAATRRAAYMVGATLAKGGFGLVTGNTPGVDSVAAAAFCAEVERAGGDPDDGYRQLWLPHCKRSCLCQTPRIMKAMTVPLTPDPSPASGRGEVPESLPRLS